MSADYCLTPLNEALQHSAVFLQVLNGFSVSVNYLQRDYDFYFQAYSTSLTDADVVHVPFPLSFDQKEDEIISNEGKNFECFFLIKRFFYFSYLGPLRTHPIVKKLTHLLHLQHCCGYVTLIRISSPAVVGSVSGGSSNLFESSHGAFGSSASRDPRKLPSSRCVDEIQRYDDFTLYDCVFGIPLFDRNLNKIICDQIKSHNLLNGAW